jgi:hypothetical protein
MRLSNDALFPLAYQDRAEDLTLFRQFARRWRPVVRTGRDEDDFDSFPSLHFGKTRLSGIKPVPRPVWSPWLWVK